MTFMSWWVFPSRIMFRTAAVATRLSMASTRPAPSRRTTRLSESTVSRDCASDERIKGARSVGNMWRMRSIVSAAEGV